MKKRRNNFQKEPKPRKKGGGRKKKRSESCKREKEANEGFKEIDIRETKIGEKTKLANENII